MTTMCPACVGLPEPKDLASAAVGTVTLSVPDVHCAACIQTIEHALRDINGVIDARVNLTLRRVQVATDVAADALVGVLKNVGYTAYPFDPRTLESKADKKGRDLLVRLGVAGFAMMNVMLMSVAVWSGATGATRDLFHLLSAAIALPAALFAAQPFFTSAWSALRVRRMNMDVPISLAIILAGGLSLFEALNGGAHAYFDAALSLTFFLLIGRVLDHRSRAVARSAAKDLAAMEVHSALRKHGSRVDTVPLSEIAVGDNLLVPAGMRIPVDGVLLSMSGFCDRSFLTGESDPVTHTRGSQVKAGEINVGAPIEIRTEAVGEDTDLRKIAALGETAETARNSYTSLADRAARIYAPAVHLLAAIAFVGWWTATGEVRHALNVAIAVLIITCPCALGLAVPAVSTAAIGKLFELGFLVKSGTALERLAQTRTLIFDKTGTLTRPGFKLASNALSDVEKSIAKALAQASAHPLSQALTEQLDIVEPAPVQDVVEVQGYGVQGVLNGQDVRLGQCDWVGLPGVGLALKVGAEKTTISTTEKVIHGAQDSLQTLAQRGYVSQIVSGDTIERTHKLSQMLGISQWHAQMAPDEKYRHVLEMSEHQPTCMLGDGINDTAALAASTASVAPGTALDAARNAADVVMVKVDLTHLPQLFAISRKSVRLSRQNFAIAALYNCVAIPVAMAGFATPLLAALAMSLSSVTVILNALRVRKVT